MSAPRLEMYFDYASPYAYMASHRVEAVTERHGAELLWLPFVLGGVFQAVGLDSPIANKVKGAYLLQDLENLARAYGVPYKPRTEFIIRSILPLRVTLQIPQGVERAKAAHAIFHGGWGEDKNIGDAETLTALLDGAGFDGKALVEGTQRQPIKDELKRNTDEAIARGAFGAPTFFLDGSQMFWGHDRLDIIDRFLGSGKG